MSFTLDVKTELLNQTQKSSCCVKAQGYGLMLFSRGFSPVNISLQTENEQLADYYCTVLYSILKKDFFIDTNGFSQMVSVSARENEDRVNILKYFNYDCTNFGLHINKKIIAKKCCVSAFLRGAFLSAGFLSNPAKHYLLEFVISQKSLAEELQELLRSINFEGKLSARDNNTVLYVTDSEQIEDILTLIGAGISSLELMNIKIYKDIRNRTNRITNCETANISKTINASTRQVEAIQKLMSHPAYMQLNDNLKKVAELRLEFLDYTLQELSKEAGLSKSGLNHRLNSLVKLAEELK